MNMPDYQNILSFNQDDLDMNRKGKISPKQKKMLKEETSSAVRDLFYIAIIFPSALIILSSVILLVWLFLNSPEMIREVAVGSLVVASVFYFVRKVLLKDLWDSNTVLRYDYFPESDVSSREPISEQSESLYSNETRLPFHLPASWGKEWTHSKPIRIYYNPTHKRILSLEEI